MTKQVTIVQISNGYTVTVNNAGLAGQLTTYCADLTAVQTLLAATFTPAS